MATRTISNTGGDWNVTGTWVEGVVPTNADVVVATGTSGNVTVSAASVCRSADFTNYVGTLTINSGQTLTVAPASGSNSLTFVAGMTLAGTGTLVVSSSGTTTCTSNGQVIPWATNWSGNSGYSLVDDWTFSALFTSNQSGGALTTINAASGTKNIYLNGGWTHGQVSIDNVTVTFQGTGTWTGTNNGGRPVKTTGGGSVVINTAGTITFASGSSRIVLNIVVNYIAGTLVPNSILLGGSTSLLGVWPTIVEMYTNGTPTLTLDNPLTVTTCRMSNAGGPRNIGATLTITTWVISNTTSSLNVAVGETLNISTITQTSTTTLTITLAGTLNITTLTTGAGANFAITGASITIGTLDILTNCIFTYQAGRTLTVSTAFRIGGGDGNSVTIQSDTPSSSFDLAVPTDFQAYKATIIDVVATGNSLMVYQAASITGCTNVFGFTTNPDNFSDPGVANVRYGTAYTYDTSPVSGTYAPPISFVRGG